MGVRISAVIPARNAEAHLAEALESVRAQRRPVHELIVVDDGSNDRTAAIAVEYGATVVAGPGGGPAGARNLGWRAASGEYVAFLDADDRWLPDHCEAVGGLLDRHAEAGLAYGLVQLFGDFEHTWDRVLKNGEPANAFLESVRHTLAQPSATIVRRALLEEMNGFDERLRYCEDFDFCIRAARLAPFVCLQRVTAMYRKHSKGLSNDVLACRRMESVILHATQERLQQEGAGDTEMRHFRSVWLASWDERIQAAWARREAAHLRVLLDLANDVPGGESIRRQWLLRRWLVSPARLWDRLPLGIRRLVRGLTAAPARPQ
jgi:glycosyltransferase involved in cell wall biosynthesis